MRISSSLASILIAASAHAETHSFSVVLRAAPTNWARSATLPKWDPSNGTLESITITLTPTAEGSLALENMRPSPVLSHATFAAAVTVTFPDTTVLAWPTPQAIFDDTLGAFDGIVDFAGNSGLTHTGISATDSVSTTYPPPASFLALFTGLGTIDVPVTAMDTSSWSS